MARQSVDLALLRFGALCCAFESGGQAICAVKSAAPQRHRAQVLQRQPRAAAAPKDSRAAPSLSAADGARGVGRCWHTARERMNNARGLRSLTQLQPWKKTWVLRSNPRSKHKINSSFTGTRPYDAWCVFGPHRSSSQCQILRTPTLSRDRLKRLA